MSSRIRKGPENRPFLFTTSAVDHFFVAISAICTHLGCTPRYLATEDKYKCPCHGSGYRGFASGWKVNGRDE
jgi:Rieske Fe-S protein